MNYYAEDTRGMSSDLIFGGENPLMSMDEITNECQKLLDADMAHLGEPMELSHDNMSLYQQIFDGQTPRQDGSHPFSENRVSPSTPGTSTGEAELPIQHSTNGRGAAGSAKSKLKGVSEAEAALLARDDSELTEGELVLKRKAQNRLAQRAFRERKETRMKQLELQLMESEDEKKRLLDQLDLVRQHNLKMQSENERLRTMAVIQGGTESPGSELNGFSFAYPRNQRDFVHDLVGNDHELDKKDLNKVYELPQNPGEKILAVGAVWDYLTRYAEELDQDIDIIEVMAQLKGNEKCHGYGPAYPMKLVQQVVERNLNR